jgi:hypothetical protein
MRIAAIIIITLVAAAVGYLTFFSGDEEGKISDAQFQLPAYLEVASITTLTTSQKEMVATYNRARQAMLENPDSIASFAQYLAAKEDATREQIVATDDGLNLEIEFASGDVIETHSNYKYLFPPHLSYNDKATILLFHDNTMWLMEDLRNELRGETIYGYRISNISFTRADSDGYKIVTDNLGEQWELSADDTVREKTHTDPDNSETAQSTGEIVERRPIPELPAFPQHSVFSKAGDITQKTPVAIEKGVQKVNEYYSDSEN